MWNIERQRDLGGVRHQTMLIEGVAGPDPLAEQMNRDGQPHTTVQKFWALGKGRDWRPGPVKSDASW